MKIMTYWEGQWLAAYFAVYWNCYVYFTGQNEDNSQISIIAGSISTVVIVALVTIGFIIIMYRYFLKYSAFKISNE